MQGSGAPTPQEIETLAGKAGVAGQVDATSIYPHKAGMNGSGEAPGDAAQGGSAGDSEQMLQQTQHTAGKELAHGMLQQWVSATRAHTAAAHAAQPANTQNEVSVAEEHEGKASRRLARSKWCVK